MHHRKLTTSILLAGLLSLGLGTPAQAENTGESGSGDAAAAGDSEPISDKQLQKFVVAMNEIRKIRQEYAPRMQQAEGEQEQKELRKEGRGEMLEAIRDTGLDAEEYNRIGRRINNDQELKRRVRELLQEQNNG